MKTYGLGTIFPSALLGGSHEERIIEIEKMTFFKKLYSFNGEGGGIGRTRNYCIFVLRGALDKRKRRLRVRIIVPEACSRIVLSFGCLHRDCKKHQYLLLIRNRSGAPYYVSAVALPTTRCPAVAQCPQWRSLLLGAPQFVFHIDY